MIRRAGKPLGLYAITLIQYRKRIFQMALLACFLTQNNLKHLLKDIKLMQTKLFLPLNFFSRPKIARDYVMNSLKIIVVQMTFLVGIRH